MLARRIIAVSPDKAFAKRLAVALKAAGGVVDTHLSLDPISHGELQAALLVMHLDGDMAGPALALIPRLASETRVIAILPRSNLAAVVDVMQGSDRVAGMMAAEDFDMKLLSAMATRVLAGDIFGLEKHVPWGAQVHSYLVGDYQEKSLCISQISEFAETMSVRRKYRESIEQCLDEMLMNALYDAPVDEQGRPIFSEIPTKTRISLRVEQKVVVQYACDGKQFVIGVRDSFGTLDRDTVLRYLHKCLHAEQQIDRKAGGAGLGLYLITNSSTGVYFNVLPGVATEAVCTFDLEAPKVQLESFGFFVEKIDAAGRLASGPSRRLPAGASHPVERRQPTAPSSSRGLIAVLAIAILAVLGLAGVAAWPRLSGPAKTDLAIHTTPPGAIVEIEGRTAGTAANGTLVVHELEIGHAYPILARLDGYEAKQAVYQPHEGENAISLDLAAHAATVILDSSPTGAQVTVDGKPYADTPVTLSTLVPGSQAQVVFKKAGYHDATTKLTVPGPGKETRLVQPMSVSDELARVKLTSDPPGAQILQNGQLVAGKVTPCDLLVEAGKPTRFVLTMPHKVPVTLPSVTPPHGADGIELSGKLVDGVALHIKVNYPDIKFRVGSVPHCQDLTAPADCIVPPGPHVVELVIQNAPRIVHPVTAKQKDVDVKFELGWLDAGPGRQLLLGQAGSARRAMFEAGPHKVTITGGDEGPRQLNAIVKPGQNNSVTN